MTASIRLSGVDAHHGQTLALSKINLDLAPGTVTSVIGRNGSGKSTLFGLISSRLSPTSGTVEVQGDVAEILQTTQIDIQLRLTVEDVVRIGRYPNRGILRRIRQVDRDAIEHALKRVDLSKLRRRPFDQLSGGQKQRALIAQGIAQDASVLLLDEPANGLDIPSQRKILDIISAEAEAGRTVLFSTHHLAEAATADTVVALSCNCVCCAPPTTALEDPAVKKLFEYA